PSPSDAVLGHVRAAGGALLARRSAGAVSKPGTDDQAYLQRRVNGSRPAAVSHVRGVSSTEKRPKLAGTGQRYPLGAASPRICHSIWHVVPRAAHSGAAIHDLERLLPGAARPTLVFPAIQERLGAHRPSGRLHRLSLRPVLDHGAWAFSLGCHGRLAGAATLVVLGQACSNPARKTRP